MDTKSEDYERRITQLEQQVEELKAVVDMLRHCKASSRYTYYNWLVEQRVSDEERTRLEALTSIFSRRFRGEDIPPYLRRTIAGLDLTPYCVDSPANYPEFADALMKAFDWEGEDTHVRAVLKSMYQQDMMLKDLCQHLLEQIGEDPNGEIYPEE